MNNIFVGNLAFNATKEDVQKLFEPFGTIANVVIMERKKGKSRGYGFVDMPEADQQMAAIAALEGKDFMGRPLHVSVLLPKEKSKRDPSQYKATPYKPESKPWSESKSFSKHYKGNPSRENNQENNESIDVPGHTQPQVSKPWVKREPYVKSEGTSKPYTSSKSFNRDDRGAKPWSKDKPAYGKPAYGKPTYGKPTYGKPYRKDDRDAKPWAKDQSNAGPSASTSRPVRRTIKPAYSTSAKPWSKDKPAYGSSAKPTGYGTKSWAKPSESKSWGPKKTEGGYKKAGYAAPYGKDSGPRRDDRESKPWSKGPTSGQPASKPGFKFFKGPAKKSWPKKGEGRK